VSFVLTVKRNKNKTIFQMALALLAAGLVFCGTAAASFVPATSPRIKTMGRWIPADNGSLYAGRGGVIASAVFEGTGVQVQMYSDSQGDVWWLKKLDDGPLIRFKAQMGMNVLYQNLSMGKHTLFLIRDTEGMRGVTILRGFYFIGEPDLPPPPAPPAPVQKPEVTDRKAVYKNVKGKTGNAGTAAVQPVQPKPRRRSIEIIGDSVAAGAFIYPEGDYFQRESGYLAFGPRLARMLRADWSCVASSGEGAVRNNEEKAPYTAKHADEQIERAFYTQKEPRWNSQMDDPDLVILAYGENDFNDAVHRPSDAYFKEQYKKLILKLRQFRPNSVIFCMTPANTVTSQRSVPGMGGAVADLRAAGDSKVYFIDLNAQGPLLNPSDFLDGVHPLASGHEKIARYLRSYACAVLGWN
jgi:lysophospholipase L1-like esterase